MENIKKKLSLQSCLSLSDPVLWVIYPLYFKCPNCDKMQTMPSLFIRKMVAFSSLTPEGEPLDSTLRATNGEGVRMNLTIFLPVGYTVLCNLSSLTKLVSCGKTIKQ